MSFLEQRELLLGCCFRIAKPTQNRGSRRQQEHAAEWTVVAFCLRSTKCAHVSTSGQTMRCCLQKLSSVTVLVPALHTRRLSATWISRFRYMESDVPRPSREDSTLVDCTVLILLWCCLGRAVYSTREGSPCLCLRGLSHAGEPFLHCLGSV